METQNEKRMLVTELYRMVRTIENTDIWVFTAELLGRAPQSFWTKPASRKYHPEDERHEYGNLIHTIRVAKTAMILCNIPNITGVSRDMVVSAAVLHDTCRHGLGGESEFSVDEHAQLVRKLAERHNITCKCSEPIFKMIEDHMGRWGVSAYTPTLDASSIIHIADCICARIAEVLNKESW